MMSKIMSQIINQGLRKDNTRFTRIIQGLYMMSESNYKPGFTRLRG